MEGTQDSEPLSTTPPLPEKTQDSRPLSFSESNHKTPKRRKTGIQSTVMQLHEAAKLVADVPQDEYDKFGAHVAAQLKELPIRNFLILQNKIQNLITEERLACLAENTSNQVTQSRTTSTDSASNDDYVYIL